MVRLYTYPSYTSLAPQGSTGFRDDANSLVTGVWKDSNIVTPAIIPKVQETNLREKLCAEQNTPKSASFDPQDPGSYTLTFYQRAVTALCNPNTRCRRLLVSATMGSGKSIIVGEILAAFANLSRYPEYKLGNPYHEANKQFILKHTPPYSSGDQALQSYYAKHPGVPSKIVFVSMTTTLEDQMYESFTRCPGMFLPFFKPVLDEATRVAGTNRREFGRYLSQHLPVPYEFFTISRLANCLSGYNCKPSTKRSYMHSGNVNNFKVFDGALVIIDEVHSIFTPEDAVKSSSGGWGNYIVNVLSLPAKAKLYGLVGLTGTPIINSYTNLIDLHKFMTTGDPFLHNPDALDRTSFVAKFSKTEPLQIEKSFVLPPAFMKACGKTSGYSEILQKNLLRPQVEDYLVKMFNTMSHYVFDYDASHDKNRMAAKTVRMIATSDLLTVDQVENDFFNRLVEKDSNRVEKLRHIERLRTDPEIVKELNKVKDSEPDLVVTSSGTYYEDFKKWAVESFYTVEGQTNYTKNKVVDSIPHQYVRHKLENSMLFNPSKLVTSTFTDSVLKDKVTFLRTLFKESPVFYQLLRRLSRRKGKALIYAAVSSKHGSELFGELVRRYVKLNPLDNLVLTVPQGLTGKDLEAYVHSKILYDKDTYLDKDNKEGEKIHDNIKASFVKSKDTGLESPIFFFAKSLSTGFSVEGGVREIHILTPATPQVESRGHRLMAHCDTDWKYDVYKYFNVGLLPSYISSCDVMYDLLVSKSNVASLMAYAEELIKRSNLCCDALNELFGTSYPSGVFPNIPEEFLYKEHV